MTVSSSTRGWCLILLFLLVSGVCVASGIPSIEEAVMQAPLIMSGTTKSVVPELLREELLKRAKINESKDDVYPAHAAVKMLELEMGWESKTSDFVNETALDAVRRKSLGREHLKPSQQFHLLSKGRKLHELLDVVVPTIRDLTFLAEWKPFVQLLHFVLVQDGDPDKHLYIPDWVDFELYNRRDIDRALGDRSWIISRRDASIRNFGFLVSKKPYVWSLDDDCLPTLGPDGMLVNAPLMHVMNLLTPSTPYFFNTVYDPYRDGSDFVRGYPYSLRGGVATAVSHGLWMNAYDYDAPTQLLKVHERNQRYADLTITVPHGTFYPMCSMNVAFDRERIGPAFMQGLMGVGQPWARYDDMFAGWASKVIADRLGLGVKSGAPYIRHNKASNPFTNLEKEYMGLKWQETIIRFFDSLKLETNSVDDLYIELAGKIEADLGSLSPYFARLARAMRLWVEVWQERHAGKLGNKLIPSRISEDKAAMAHSSEPPISLAAVTHLSSGIQSKIFGNYPVDVTLAAEDFIEEDTRIKVFVANLPSKYNKDCINATLEQTPQAQLGLNPESNIALQSMVLVGAKRRRSMSSEFRAELTLIAKFVAAADRTGALVRFAEDADVVIVPAFQVMCGPQKGVGLTTADSRGLLNAIPTLRGSNNMIKPHLFFASEDAMPPSVFASFSRSQLSRSSSRLPKSCDPRAPASSRCDPLRMGSTGWVSPPLIRVTYGTAGSKLNDIVVPPAIIEQDVQPAFYKPTPYESKSVLAFMMCGAGGNRVMFTPEAEKNRKNLITAMRKPAPGNQRVELHVLDTTKAQATTIGPRTGIELHDRMRNAVFCPCPTGDLPYQKRFFDALLSDCIPVVFRFPSNEGTGFSFWPRGPMWNRTLPFANLEVPGAIDYRRAILQLEVDQMPNLLQILDDEPVDRIKARLDYIVTIRNKLVYDFKGTQQDAFSNVLREIKHKAAILSHLAKKADSSCWPCTGSTCAAVAHWASGRECSFFHNNY